MDLIYSGTKRLTDAVEGLAVDVGQLVLSPTRTYAPVVIAALARFRQHISGMVHCSGGAQTKVLHFVDRVHIVKDNLFPIPPLFELIQAQSATDWREMYKVFNMGHRFEIYLPPEMAQGVIEIAESFGVQAQIVGHVEACESRRLTIKSDKGTFDY
jgi:phosphoribosylformylglycinamidine cyclo-ligase